MATQMWKTYGFLHIRIHYSGIKILNQFRAIYVYIQVQKCRSDTYTHIFTNTRVYIFTYIYTQFICVSMPIAHKRWLCRSLSPWKGDHFRWVYKHSKNRFRFDLCNSWDLWNHAARIRSRIRKNKCRGCWISFVSNREIWWEIGVPRAPKIDKYDDIISNWGSSLRLVMAKVYAVFCLVFF